MKYIFKILLILKITITYAFSDVINDVQVKNNNRITKETIITFGNIEFGKDYSQDQLNNILKFCEVIFSILSILIFLILANFSKVCLIKLGSFFFPLKGTGDK